MLRALCLFPWQVFVVLHVTALSYYVYGLLPPKAFRIAQTLIVTFGTYVIMPFTPWAMLRPQTFSRCFPLPATTVCSRKCPTLLSHMFWIWARCFSVLAQWNTGACFLCRAAAVALGAGLVALVLASPTLGWSGRSLSLLDP